MLNITHWAFKGQRRNKASAHTMRYHNTTGSQVSLSWTLYFSVRVCICVLFKSFCTRVTFPYAGMFSSPLSYATDGIA